MAFARKTWTMARKDLCTELRSKQTLLAMCLFTFLVLVVFSFAFEGLAPASSGERAGVLWTAFLFASLFGTDRAFGSEIDRGTLSGLRMCPVSPWSIYLAKLTATVVLAALMEALTVLMFVVLFNLDRPAGLLPLTLVVFLGTLGFAAVGTLFSAMSASSGARDRLLAILVFPVSVPVLVAAVQATALILEGGGAVSALSWLKLLAAFDMAFLLVAYLTFGFVLEEC